MSFHSQYTGTTMKSWPRAIAHIDADCFFVAVELLRHPDLKGKPVLVCNRTDTRGIVVSASYEARAFGIRAGTAVFQARERCPQGIFLITHFEEYQMASFRLLQILKQFSPDVEMCSIDEAYVDLTGMRMLFCKDYAQIAALIQKTVIQKLSITVSVGLAPTKLLAKIASDFKKPAGLTVVSIKTLKEFLHHVHIKDIPGVGANTEALLKKFRFHTAHDLVHSEDLRMLLGKRGEFLRAELSGTVMSPVQSHEAAPKSLSHTRTFPDFSCDRDYIFSFSSDLLLKLLKRLRRHKLRTEVLGFFLMTKGFTVRGLKRKLDAPTHEDAPLLRQFQDMFSEIFQTGVLYRKAGFFLSNVEPMGPTQCSLFETPDKPISATLDGITGKYGEKAIFRGFLLNFPSKKA